VEGLTIAPRAAPDRPIVADVTLTVAVGGALGIVGESGSGKSLTCLAAMGLLPRGLHRTAGRVTFDGAELTALAPDRLAAVRGRGIAMVFQDPAASLNPLRTVGGFLGGLLRLYRGLVGPRASGEAADLLRRVGIAAPAQRLSSYPHELSGGQGQRVMIAGALAGVPRLLLADEPTTALDVTTQAQILALVEDLREKEGMGLVIVSHDFGVIARAADEVAVMYAGRIVERAGVRELFRAPRHPYTRGLLDSVPPDAGGLRPAPLPPQRAAPGASAPGCAFAPRCLRASGLCRAVRPALAETAGRAVACHHPLP
jgi:peptide/nickel transport system ATP-binding protein